MSIIQKGKLVGIALGAVCSIYTLPAHADFFRALPQATPLNVDALTFAPHFDFDTDSCLPDAGISSTGQQNGGLKNSGSITGGCRRTDFMNFSNTYHRYVCKTTNANYCAHIYALYFQKDQAVAGVDAFGHRHDWEYTVVWTRNGQPTHFSTSAHGKLTTHDWNSIEKDGNHPKAVYHKDGGLTHAFRFAKAGENRAENPTGRWVLPPLVSWYTMHGQASNATLRDDLNRYNYDHGIAPFLDHNMLKYINPFRPAGYPTYNNNDMVNSK
ncbi:NPP1 family protein [Vibrio palustris]|uniref:Necrosis inducing protein (NPP1) n=1 Tax=Vibrio palustris TaxID=1918946 RepID=A0A1R4B647_9VIBR|nr:NPP1 family protein [Vibrio palustris]SJL84394.1 Necrosis inducing protein (NPP1) [Vibrio palustris]